jgi:hypothetical protein
MFCADKTGKFLLEYPDLFTVADQPRPEYRLHFRDFFFPDNRFSHVYWRYLFDGHISSTVGVLLPE